MSIRLTFILLLLSQMLFGQQVLWRNTTPAVTASFRGLSVVDNNVAWVSGSKGWIGKTGNGGESWSMNQIKGKELLDFRSVFAFSSI